MAEGLQIEIPDFDEDDSYSTPNVFGKPSNPFSFGGGASSVPFGGGFEPDSPTSMTPTPLFNEKPGRTYFHSRTDSMNSEDSASSAPFPSQPRPPAQTPKQSGNPPAPTKKSSLASLKNAFIKAGKNSDAPPLPPLRNAFNRSTSSLAGAVAAGSRRPSIAASGTPALSSRPTTPASGDVRYTRGLSSKPKSHQHARSFQAQNGSGLAESVGDFGFGASFRSSSPPPLPPMPEGIIGQRSEQPVGLGYQQEQVALDPRTPSDYALHAVFMRFATSAEAKIDAFLRESLDAEPRLPDSLGPGVDSQFDDLLASLGKIAQKHTKPVVDSVMRWRKSHNEGVSAEITRYHAVSSPAPRSGGHQQQPSSVRFQSSDPESALNHRKVLASIYIMCRALIAVVEAVSAAGNKDCLSEATGYMLEETTFDQFRKPDFRLLSQSANHRVNAELYAKLLGELADVRFISVTDRFVAELAPVASGQVMKDADMHYEMLLRGLKHIRMKVYPPEDFEEGAEFLESLSRAFDNAHGFGLKSAFAETLTNLLHPIGRTAQAEVNLPTWAKAIEVIYLKAFNMMNKPRYWSVAYPLVITSLCVAPQDFFLKHWMACVDTGFIKAKEKQFRLPVLNGMIRLIWTFLFRCPEQASVATSKLDAVLKNFFPANRMTVFPPMDDHVEPFIYIMHFVLVRHPEFGSDIIAELMQEGTLSAASASPPTGQVITNVVSSERFSIAVKAVLLSIHGVEVENPIPAWPSSPDFASLPPHTDYPTAAGVLAEEALASRPSLGDVVERLRPLVNKVASWCKTSVGRMTVFDDTWSVAHNPIAYEESHNYVIRRHPEGNCCYPTHLLPQMAMLRTCFYSWPRLLDLSVPLNDTLDELLCGVVHVEPGVADVATSALRRLMEDPARTSGTLARFADFLFDTVHKTRDGAGVRLLLESRRIINLWVSVVGDWIQRVMQMESDPQIEDAAKKDIILRIDEIETGALFLLSLETWALHSVGAKVIRILLPLRAHKLLFPPTSPTQADGAKKPLRIIDLLLSREETISCLSGYDEHLDTQALARLDHWRRMEVDDVLLRIAEGDHDRDRRIWRFVFPAFFKLCTKPLVRPVGRVQDTLVAAAARLHPFVLSVAGLRSRSARAPGNPGPEREPGLTGPESAQAVLQWAAWMTMICSLSDAYQARAVAGHARALSELGAEREKMSTPRGLYKYLFTFLESEHAIFRGTASLCISLLPAATYSQLLEELSLFITRHFHDDARTKAGGSSIGRGHRQEELYTAVARIYYLTAHFLQDARLPSRSAALANVLKFVRRTQEFLSSPDNRDRFQLQRLRRYFCGTVERMFDGIATLNDFDRFIPPNTYLSLYRLCEEWCQFGSQSAVVKQRLVLMQTRAANASETPQGKADSIERFQTQTKKLSRAAVHTLASLCHKAYFPPESSSESPVERGQDAPQPLDPVSTLDRITSILASYDEAIRAGARKSLRLLLSHGNLDGTLAEETMRRGFVTTTEAENSNARFFEIVADVICDTEGHAFTFSQVVCLGLMNLCNPVTEVRRHAFRALDALHRRSNGPAPLTQYEAGVQSASPGVYLLAYRQITDALARVHHRQAYAVLTQVANWMPRITENGYGRLPLLVMQSLEAWIQHVRLTTDEPDVWSEDGGVALCHLVSLTYRYVDIYAEQVTAVWTSLVNPRHAQNGRAVIRFLLEQSQKVGTPGFAACSSKIVACLCETSIRLQLLDELCAAVSPADLRPSDEHRLMFPNPGDVGIWESLDALFSEEPRLPLGRGQFALLFLSDVAPSRPWESTVNLPILLNAIFVHLDHRRAFVQQRARYMLMQLLRACVPAYEDLELSVKHRLPAGYPDLTELELELPTKLWKEEDLPEVAIPKMRWLCQKVFALLEPLCPHLAAEWGSLCLKWATGCPVRAIALRSLHLFRAIMPAVTKDDVGTLVGRLANHIADPDEQMQSYIVEVLRTLTFLASSPKLDANLLPQFWWCAVACLSTPVEAEFAQSLAFMGALLDRLDLDDPMASELLLSQRPAVWKGPSTVQPALLAGLRSSTTSDAAFKLLQRLSRFNDDALVDDSDARLRALYTLVLPWCLSDMASETRDPALSAFAERIAQLAEAEERTSLARIMVSFVKGRFRTKDDFLRQSAMCLREQYGAAHWAEVVTLLLGLTLNGQRWLRLQTLQVLKVLFAQKNARAPVDALGAELLMPLLRLVESDVAAQALDVLEEPLGIAGGGLEPRHVLRMSMHLAPPADDAGAHGAVFGVPSPSGWCVPRTADARERVRANVEAVFDTCKSDLRPSRMYFHPEGDAGRRPPAGPATDAQEDVGDLVQDLHELSSFFQRPALPAGAAPGSRRQAPPGQVPMPSTQSVARWAAILAKSTDDANGIPQTPFLDVFRVQAGADFSDADDDDSGSETESDLFYFDSPAFNNHTMGTPYH